MKKNNSVDINDIRRLVSEGKIIWTIHCAERMRERGISKQRGKDCIFNGEIIMEYPDDLPNPSCLIYDFNGEDVVHIVVGNSSVAISVITAYHPDLTKFLEDLKTRRK